MMLTIGGMPRLLATIFGRIIWRMTVMQAYMTMSPIPESVAAVYQREHRPRITTVPVPSTGRISTHCGYIAIINIYPLLHAPMTFSTLRPIDISAKVISIISA